METIRTQFADKLKNQEFTSIAREKSMLELTGNTTIELVGASFLADEPALFGTPNEEYIKREETWYNSMSLNVNAIPGGPPAIWKAVADADGNINSNYGWCIYSVSNGFKGVPAVSRLCQYTATLNELRKNPASRRAVMIYTRPSMWLDYNKNGRSDFMCTNDVQYLLRNDVLHAIVNMRSNDAIMGFKNDLAWQKHVLQKLAGELDVPPGPIHWNAGSLHVYARHYYLVDHYSKTGLLTISKEQYALTYPESPYL